MKVIIIGASFAGVSCALQTKKLYPDADVMIIESKSVLGYIPSGLNWYYKQKISDLTQSVFTSREELMTNGITIAENTTVEEIYHTKKQILCGTTNKTYTLSYDKLVIATGSTPHSTYIQGADDKRVLLTKDYQDSEYAKEKIRQAQHITVIGGGQIGIEVSEMCSQLGKSVTIVEAADRLDFKNFDVDMLNALTVDMKKAGIVVKLSQRVKQIDGTLKNKLKIITDKDTIETDIAILCINFRPNSDLVSGIVERHIDKTIKVNAYMQTSQSDIFAVGDVIKTPVVFSDSKQYIPLINFAIRSGEVAAFNLLAQTYPILPATKLIGSYNYQWYRACVGLTAEEASYYEDIYTFTYQEPLSLLDKRYITIKLVVHRETGTIRGGQVISLENCLCLANLLSMAMTAKLNDEQIAFQDFLFKVDDFDLMLHLHKAALGCFEARRNLCKLGN